MFSVYQVPLPAVSNTGARWTTKIHQHKLVEDRELQELEFGCVADFLAM